MCLVRLTENIFNDVSFNTKYLSLNTNTTLFSKEPASHSQGHECTYCYKHIFEIFDSILQNSIGRIYSTLATVA